ncbi:MAG: low molecular weight protein arginine phosphatase [Elusimicrobia bacterium]|nr:low molecular weight protein arginine phosphatase [Elusimicrobiota bacterium]
MKKVLFVCTGNTCRSVLAHYYAAKLAADGKLKIAFTSAGLEATPDIPQPKAVADLLAKEGVKNFKHVPVALTGKMIKSNDLVLAMTAGHKAEIIRRYARAAKKTHTLVDYAGFGNGDVADPFGRDDFFYFEVFKLIKSAVEAALEKLKKK